MTMRGPRLSMNIPHGFQRDMTKPVAADVACGRRYQIDDPAADERTAIVDAHHDRTAAAIVGDANERAKRQRLMRRRQADRAARIEMLAVGSQPTLVIDRRNPAFSWAAAAAAQSIAAARKKGPHASHPWLVEN